MYSSDKQLAYLENRTLFDDKNGLKFDEAYRLAHLPLVAPDHPRVIRKKANSGYDMGKHEWVYSIALPLPRDILYRSQNFLNLIDKVKSSRFATKVSWDTLERRKDKIHATVCGSLSVSKPPIIDDNTYAKLKSLGPFGVKVGGFFSGNLNVGRLYLRIYPEQRDGKNVCHEIQRIFDRPITHLYLAGILNLTDELCRDQASELAEMINRYWDEPIVTFQCDMLWLLKSRDDLVLDGSIAEVIDLK